MIISALVLLACVAGVVGLWAAKEPVEQFTVAIFSPVESGLETANAVLERANARVENARDKVSNAQEVAGQLGQGSIASNGLVANAISPRSV
jgi:hypothetical protein